MNKPSDSKPIQDKPSGDETPEANSTHEVSETRSPPESSADDTSKNTEATKSPSTPDKTHPNHEPDTEEESKLDFSRSRAIMKVESLLDLPDSSDIDATQEVAIKRAEKAEEADETDKPEEPPSAADEDKSEVSEDDIPTHDIHFNLKAARPKPAAQETEQAEKEREDETTPDRPVQLGAKAPTQPSKSSQMEQAIEETQKDSAEESAEKSSEKTESPAPQPGTAQLIPKDDADTEPKKPDTAVLIRKRKLRRSSGFRHNVDTVTFGEKRELIMVIRGLVERVELPEDRAIVLGRADPNTRFHPDIDLTPYGALDRGVSRGHAKLHIEDGTLYITDLGSTNGTFLAGKRLEPHEPMVLHKGDELLLGRLAIQILFR